MDEAIPSMSSGSVGSRFVSQAELDQANAVRDEQWKAAYARYLSLLVAYCLLRNLMLRAC